MLADKTKLFAIGLPERDVPIPELGDGVFIRVRALTGRELDDYQASLIKERKNKRTTNYEDATARLVVLTCINEDGTPFFGDDEVATVSKRVGAKILGRLSKVAQELSGVTDEEIEELVKN